MAVQVIRVCDYDSEEGNHPSSFSVQIQIDKTYLGLDICLNHSSDLIRDLQRIGFKPTQVRVNKENRAGYTAASGVVFTSKDVREWLRSRGIEVADVGVLPKATIEEYAAVH